MIRVGLDYDDTLSRKDVQDFVIDNPEYNYFIISARCTKYSTNSDIYNMAERLGINSNNIILTNYLDKSQYMMLHNIPILLDDSKMVLAEVRNRGYIGVDSKDKKWQENLISELWKIKKKI